MSGPSVFLVAAEPSGDNIGAKLMAALRRASDGVRFAGIGGERMAGEGLQTLFPIGDLSVMGIAEVVPRLPTIFDRLRRTAAEIRAARPDVVVLIDSPSFGLRVADRIRDTGIPVVQYVAPQLWAWRPGRAKKLGRRVDAILALLPFEPAFFAGLGLACVHVGHPVLEDVLTGSDRQEFRRSRSIPAGRRLVMVMPGSRVGLFGRMAPVFLETARLLARGRDDLTFVLPHVRNTEKLSERLAAELPGEAIRIESAAEKRAAYLAADVALSISGTTTLELAVAGLPTVVGHRVNALSAFLARRLIKVPFVAMPNVIAGRAVIPELLQEDCTPERLAGELATLLDDPAAAARMRADLAAICDALGNAEIAKGPGHLPSDRAAAAVLAEISRRR
ncbi:MAG: lipid-A-disaccharide synthase [Rhodospirillales bacterium]|nr:lipid-A-disaccharide synthase [Rhodospirillales bacterium]